MSLEEMGSELKTVAVADSALIAAWFGMKGVRWFFRLMIDKGLFEPLAALTFKKAWTGADRLSGDRLPDLPPALGGEAEECDCCPSEPMEHF